MPRWLPLLCCALLAAPAWALDAAQAEDLAVKAAARPLEGLHAWQDVAAGMLKNDPERWQALLGAGLAAAVLGLPQTLDQVTTELATTQPEAAECVRAEQMRRHGSVREAAARLSALKLPADAPLAVRYHCHLIAGLALDARGAFDQALPHYEAAQAAADALGSPSMRATARSAMALAFAHGGQDAHAQRLHEEALGMARAAGEWVIVGNVLADRAAMLPRGAADAPQRRALLQQALDAWRRVDAEHRMVGGLVAMSDEALQAGDLAGARANASDALARAQALHLQPAEMDTARLKLGVALIGLRHLDEGLGQVREAVASQREAESLVRVGAFLLEAAQMLESSGYPAQAYGLYAEYRLVFGDLTRQLRQQALADFQERQDAQARQAERQRLVAERALSDESLAQQRLRLGLATVAGAVSLVLALVAGMALRRMHTRARSLKKAHELAQRDAGQDPLTGLASREAGAEWMQAQVGAAPGTLLLLDVDHFKEVNDSHGHAAGDAVLVALARRLLTVVREGDLVARWGGEEFLIAIGAGEDGGAPAPDAQMAWAQRVSEAVRGSPVRVGTAAQRITISVGVAPWRQGDAGDWDDALARADAALYGAKLLGRDGIVAVRVPGRAPSDPPADAQEAQAICAAGVWVHRPGGAT